MRRLLHTVLGNGSQAVSRWSNALGPRIPDENEVRRNLEADEVLLQIVSLGDKVFTLVTRRAIPTQVAAVSRRDEVLAGIARLRAAVATRPRSGPPTSPFPPDSHRLYKALLAPAVLDDRIRLVSIVLGESLQTLPANALLTAPWREGQGYAEQAWIDKRFALRILPGAKAVKSVAPRPVTGRPTAGQQSFVGVGAPALTGSGPGCGSTVAQALAGRIPPGPAAVAGLCPLPQTADMLSRFARAAGGEATVLTHSGATLSALRQAGLTDRLRNARTVAFATHGLRSAEAMALTGVPEPALVLTPDAAAGTDGLLRASEIANLGLNADLVVLAACGSGVREDAPSGTWRGLVDAFLVGGARALLVAGWSVDEDATAQLLKRLLAGEGVVATRPAETLRTAMQQLRDGTATGGRATYQHPYYWAPFAVVGTRGG